MTVDQIRSLLTLLTTYFSRIGGFPLVENDRLWDQLNRTMGELDSPGEAIIMIHLEVLIAMLLRSHIAELRKSNETLTAVLVELGNVKKKIK